MIQVFTKKVTYQFLIGLFCWTNASANDQQPQTLVVHNPNAFYAVEGSIAVNGKYLSAENNSVNTTITTVNEKPSEVIKVPKKPVFKPVVTLSKNKVASTVKKPTRKHQNCVVTKPWNGLGFPISSNALIGIPNTLATVPSVSQYTYTLKYYPVATLNLFYSLLLPNYSYKTAIPYTPNTTIVGKLYSYTLFSRPPPVA